MIFISGHGADDLVSWWGRTSGRYENAQSLVSSRAEMILGIARM